MPSRPPDIRADHLPVLSHLGSGSQYHVFGESGWVIKTPRISPLSLISSALRSRRWLHRIQLEVGDLVLPFAEIERVAFRAPVVRTSLSEGTAVPNTQHVYRARRALVSPAAKPSDFLDQRFYAAGTATAITLLRQMLDHLEALRSRRFIMLDFIMKNFVFHNRKLLIADPGLIVPAHLTRWHPSFLTTALQFRHFLLRDYRDLLQKKNAPTHFITEFADRITALTKPPTIPPTNPVPAVFPPAVARDALDTLLPS
ncbi:MAG: hypothetical protein P8J87_02600 [Verrucomicrobiales bacterium]|nr:hypothetical protein [Verrucomicrobiales bacterium]